MMIKRSMLALSVAAIVLLGCKKKEDTQSTPAPAAEATAPATTAEAPVAAPVAASPTAAAAHFDLKAFPISDKPLGEWPYLQMPAGYHLDGNDSIAAGTKDLARVPVWTGQSLLWVEGKTFEADIRTDEGKTFSKFELYKGIENAITALGGQRVVDKPFDEKTAETNEAAMKSFLKEFGKIDDAYRYYNDASTFLIRRADKAIWVVTSVDENGNAAVMVAEGPISG